jgi:hypothetical protein
MRSLRLRSMPGSSARAIDQVLNSASSAAFSFGLLAACNDQTLGELTMQLIPVTIGLGLIRTALYDGLLLRRRDTTSNGSGIPVIVGALSGIVVGLIGAMIGWAVGLPATLLLAISLSTAVVMTFDGFRFSAFMLDRGGTAAFADLLWLVGSMVALGVTAFVDELRPTNVAIIYLSSGVAASCVFAQLRPGLRAAVAMLRTRTTGTDLRFGVDHLLQVVPGYLALIGGGVVASLAAVGQLRGAVIVYSPLASAMYAIRLTLLRPDHDDRGRGGVPTSVAVYGWTAVAYTTIVVGAFSFARSTFDGVADGLSTSLLVLVGLGEVGRFATQGFVDEARRAGRLRLAARMRLEQGIALVTLSVPLAAVWNATGLGLARALAHVVPVGVVLFGAMRASAHVTGGPPSPQAG